MLGRNIFAVAWLVVTISLAIYVGIGYTILLGYLFIITILVIPLRFEWVNSNLVKGFLGRLYNNNTELIFRGLSKSRGYKVCVVITSVILIAVSIFFVIALNFKLIEVF